MYDYIPKYYEDIREARAIIDTDADSISGLIVNIDDVLAQFHVDTATWGLEIWERFVGLPSNATYSVWNSLEQRSIIFDGLE